MMPVHVSRHILLLLFVALTLLLSGTSSVLLAQEANPTLTPSPPPTHIATATLIPTDTPTEIPPSPVPSATLILPTSTQPATASPIPTAQPETTPGSVDVTAEPTEPTPDVTMTLTPGQTETTTPTTGGQTPTATVEPEVIITEATATSSVLPMATPTTNASLQQYLVVDFESSLPTLWTLPVGWSVVTDANRSALRADRTGQVDLPLPPLYEAEAAARVQVITGSASLSLRVSPAGAYTATLDSAGMLRLYRQGVIVAETQMPPEITQPLHLRLIASPDTMRVQVNATEVLRYVDIAPLPPGGIQLGVLPNASDTAQVYFDDLNVWVAAGEFTNLLPTPITAALPPIAGPILLAPTDNSSTADETPTLSWDAVNTAVLYRVQVSGDSRFRSTVFETETPDTTIDIATILPDGRYFWRVQAVNGFDVSGRWSRVWRFIVDTDAPDAPMLVSPNDSAATKDTTPLLSWRPVRGATTYQVQVARDDAFTDVLPLTTDASRQPRLIVNPALDQGVYYWRVASIDAAGNQGAWSSGRELVISIQINPHDGTVLRESGGTAITSFSWARIPGVIAYQVQIAVDNAFIEVIHTSANQTRNVYRLSAADALPVGVYYWRVNIDEGSGFVPSPVSRRLTVSPPPPAGPILLAPTDNSSTADETPTLSWDAVDTAVLYRVQVSGDSRFRSTVFDTETPDTTIDIATILPDGRYFWRVQAVNGFDVSGRWSRAWRFIVDTNAPDAPVLIQPVTGSSATTTQPFFQWQRIRDASSYELQLSVRDDFSDGGVSHVSTSTRFSPPGPLLFANYYWRVRSIDRSGNPSEWSETWSVQLTTNQPTAPILNSFDTSAPTLTWSPITWAIAYEVQVDNDPRFVSPNYSDDRISRSSRSVTIDPLADGIWYWRVRVRNAAGTWSAWSPIQTFSIVTGS